MYRKECEKKKITQQKQKRFRLSDNLVHNKAEAQIVEKIGTLLATKTKTL